MLSNTGRPNSWLWVYKIKSLIYAVVWGIVDLLKTKSSS